MKTATLAGVVLLLAGCSEGEKDDPEPCALSHRVGTYLQVATERANGSCGPLPDQVLRTDDATSLAPNCRVDAPDEVSANKCKISRSFSCTVDTGNSTTTWTTTEEDGGAKLVGVTSITLYDATGEFLCASAYDVTYTRQ